MWYNMSLSILSSENSFIHNVNSVEWPLSVGVRFAETICGLAISTSDLRINLPSIFNSPYGMEGEIINDSSWDFIKELPRSDSTELSFSFQKSRLCTFNKRKTRVNSLLADQKTDPMKRNQSKTWKEQKMLKRSKQKRDYHFGRKFGDFGNWDC
jgi:hypothetical protein